MTALITAATHWLIDSAKKEIQRKCNWHEHTAFLADQAMHVLVLFLIWTSTFGLYPKCLQLIGTVLTDYRTTVVLTAYAVVIWPIAYLLRFALQKMAAPNTLTGNTDAADTTESVENAGRLIGQFERVIVLTFILLDQYAAIGFLLTGKSIIRFADKKSQLRGEYVLVGTLMSMGICIVTGLTVKGLFSLL